MRLRLVIGMGLMRSCLQNENTVTYRDMNGRSNAAGRQRERATERKVGGRWFSSEGREVKRVAD